jgi:beta-lactamase regulating signal transducer with metallopeptidase domain
MAPIVLYLGGLILRTLVIAVLVWIATLFVRNAAVRHAMWTAVLILMLLLPLADLALPQTMVPRNAIPNEVFYLSAPQVYYEPARAVMNATPEPLVPAQIQLNILASRLLGLPLYLLVAGLLMARVALAFVQVFRLKRSGVAVEIAGVSVDVRVSERVHVPVTLGFLRPVVVLPADWESWDEWELRAVLAHELAHVQRRDWAIAVLAAVNKSVFWFNPLSWWLERRISRLSEEAADEVSLNVVGDAPRYAGLLVRFASAQNGRRLFVAHVAMARKKIAERVDRVLALKAPGLGVLPRVAWIAVMVLAMPVLYAAAALHVGPAPIPMTPIAFTSGPPQPYIADAVRRAALDSDTRRMRALMRGSSSSTFPPSRGSYSSGFSSPTGLPHHATVGFAASATNASLGMNAHCPATECSFVVTDVAANLRDRTVKISGQNPGATAEITYTCVDCSMALGLDSFGIPTAAPPKRLVGPGVVLTLNGDATVLTIECGAQKCKVGDTISSLSMGQSVKVPTSSPIRFMFSR